LRSGVGVSYSFLFNGLLFLDIGEENLILGGLMQLIGDLDFFLLSIPFDLEPNSEGMLTLYTLAPFFSILRLL